MNVVKIDKMKLRYIIYIVAIIITLIVIYSSCSCNYEEINYLPEGFTGKVFIIMNQKDGKNIEYLGNRRVYKIPECGILKTKFKEPEFCFTENEINNALIYVRIDKYGNVIDTAKALPSFENESERDSFINLNKYNLYFTELGFLSSTFGDTEHYEYIQVSVVDSAKNILEYGFPLMEKEDLEKCK